MEDLENCVIFPQNQDFVNSESFQNLREVFHADSSCEALGDTLTDLWTEEEGETAQVPVRKELTRKAPMIQNLSGGRDGVEAVVKTIQQLAMTDGLIGSGI